MIPKHYLEHYSECIWYLYFYMNKNLNIKLENYLFRVLLTLSNKTILQYGVSN